MKFAVLNDTHAGVRNDSVHFMSMKFYEEVFPYLLENDIKHIVHLGDYLIKGLVLTFCHYKETKNTLSTI